MMPNFCKVTGIKKNHFAKFANFGKNEPCATCGTHKPHNPNMVTDKFTFFPEMTQDEAYQKVIK